ncbi:MAG: hypothetical protein Q7V20_22915, partial [Aquabacterium sp.]|nr:hypothetical protein [Aquabacterium sp.]
MASKTPMTSVYADFSAANLWRVRNFFKTYVTDKKLAPMVQEIGWSHNENPSIGMILCRAIKRTTVEYALK